MTDCKNSLTEKPLNDDKVDVTVCKIISFFYFSMTQIVGGLKLSYFDFLMTQIVGGRGGVHGAQLHNDPDKHHRDQDGSQLCQHDQGLIHARQLFMNNLLLVLRMFARKCGFLTLLTGKMLTASKSRISLNLYFNTFPLCTMHSYVSKTP